MDYFLNILTFTLIPVIKSTKLISHSFHITASSEKINNLTIHENRLWLTYNINFRQCFNIYLVESYLYGCAHLNFLCAFNIKKQTRAKSTKGWNLKDFYCYYYHISQRMDISRDKKSFITQKYIKMSLHTFGVHTLHNG